MFSSPIRKTVFYIVGEKSSLFKLQIYNSPTWVPVRGSQTEAHNCEPKPGAGDSVSSKPGSD